MSKQKSEKLLESIQRLAGQLSEGEETLSRDELREELRESGVDPDKLKARFHEAAKLLAQRERLANKSVSSSLKQAIDSTCPEGQIPNDPIAAKAFSERWISGFRSVFHLPTHLTALRAYRKSGDLSPTDLKDLDDLEEDLKRKVMRENE